MNTTGVNVTTQAVPGPLRVLSVTSGLAYSRYRAREPDRNFDDSEEASLSRASMLTYRCSGPQRHVWPTPDDAARCCNGYHRVRVLTQAADGTYHLVGTWERVEQTGLRHDWIMPPRASAAPPIRQPSAPRLVTDRSPEHQAETLRHQAFLHAVDGEVEGSAEYRALTAGLVVLRLLDQSEAVDAAPTDLRRRERGAVKRTIEAVASEPLRQVLIDLFHAITSRTPSEDGRIPAVVSYAQVLEQTARWEAAADVYLSATDLMARRPDAQDLMPLCYSRAGICLRHAGDLGRASDLFHEGIRAAQRLGSVEWMLRLRLSLARIESHKGNLPAAGEQLDAIVQEAEAARLPSVVAAARHDEGHVAFIRGQYVLAVEHFFEAMKLYAEPYLKERAMYDLSAALIELGFLSFARTVCSALYNAADHAAQTHVLAGLNLLRIAILDGDVGAFDRLRQELANERMSTRFLAHYHLLVGQGLRRAGDEANARAAFEEAIIVAEANQLNQLIFEADTMLKTAAAEPLPPSSAASLSAGLASALDEIQHRRGEFAGATE
jgi:tetratricopeptide (TPR) repeat protein